MRNQLQTNSKWASKLIGNTSLTVNSYGCTLTSLANIADINPIEAETLLHFNSEGQVIWDSIKHIGLEFIYRHGNYNDKVVKQAIKDYGFCLVECDYDGSKQTRDTHWFVSIGDGLIIDPLGREDYISGYPVLTGSCIIRKLGENMPDPQLQSLGDQLKLFMKRYGKGSYEDFDKFLIEHLGKDGQGGFLKSERDRNKKLLQDTKLIASLLNFESYNLEEVLEAIKGWKDQAESQSGQIGSNNELLQILNNNYYVDAYIIKRKK